MQVVIDIPEKVYSYIKREWVENDFDSPMNNAMNGIKNGTPLPEGHGRLIDADELIKGRVENDNTVILVSNAKTIIPEDKKERY